jgi:phosphatidylglycerophosphate synthase
VIDEAVVVAGPGDAERRVAGVPLLLRTVLTLQRAGIARCAVAGAAAPSDPRVRIPVASAEPPSDGALRVVVGPGTVVDAVLVRRLVADERSVAYACGTARVGVTPGDAPPGPPPCGTLEAADAAPARIEQALLLGLENARDGYIDRLLHRRLSRPITRRLLSTAVTPNAVTFVGLALGIASGLALGVASPLVTVLAVVGLVLSGALDCVDGELARIRFAESKLGHVLDVTGDTLVHAALLLGIGIRLSRAGQLPDASVLTVLGLGILGAFLVITAAEVTEQRRHRAPGWENAIIDGILSPLTTRDWYVFPVTFALLGRLDLMVPAAAVGAHVFWIVTLVILLRVLGRTR